MNGEPPKAPQQNPTQRLSQEISELSETVIELSNIIDKINDMLFTPIPKSESPGLGTEPGDQGKIEQFADRVKLIRQMAADVRDVASRIENQSQS